MSIDKPTKISGSFEQTVAANERYNVHDIGAIVGGHTLNGDTSSLAIIKASHKHFDNLADVLANTAAKLRGVGITVGETLKTQPFATSDIDAPEKIKHVRARQPSRPSVGVL